MESDGMQRHSGGEFPFALAARQGHTSFTLQENKHRKTFACLIQPPIQI
jgi:hypothetical protein